MSYGFGGLIPPASPFFVFSQRTATTVTYAIDHAFTQDEVSPASPSVYVWYVRFHLECDAAYGWSPPGFRDAGSPACDFDFGDSSVSLAAAAPSVIFERVAPLRRTTPRSAAYLSPASGPIQTFPGTPGIPSTASGSGDVGQGATGDGSASADVPLVNAELVDTTGAASHLDQAAVTANANATVASEGQSAASLRYHATFLNGAQLSDYPNGLPLSVQVPTVNATLSATKGLDPSIVQHASFELTIDVQGVPLFHFVTLSLGSSNEDPPGLSGDLGPLCSDSSTATAQSCTISGSLKDQDLSVHPDAHDDVVLTVQTDCATSLTHPSGPLPATHVACDASHTVTAKLASLDGNVLLTPVPEPTAASGALAALGAIGLVGHRRRRVLLG